MTKLGFNLNMQGGANAHTRCEPFEAKDDGGRGRFLATAYRCVQGPGAAHWRITGLVLNKDGTPNRGNVMGHKVVTQEDVPDDIRATVARRYEDVAEAYRAYFTGLADQVRPS